MLTLFQLKRRGIANVLTKQSTTDKKEDSAGFEMTAFYFTELANWIKSSEHFYSKKSGRNGQL
jgi:hypothetical protein